jgi:hypothetical protein
MTMIGEAVRGLDRPGMIVPAVQKLGERQRAMASRANSRPQSVRPSSGCWAKGWASSLEVAEAVAHASALLAETMQAAAQREGVAA